MSGPSLQSSEVEALVNRLGIGGHCVGDKVLYVRRVDSRWSELTRVNIEHVIQESIDLAVKSFTDVLKEEMRVVEHKVRCEAYKEEMVRTRKAVRAAVYREKKRAKQAQKKGSQNYAENEASTDG